MKGVEISRSDFYMPRDGVETMQRSTLGLIVVAALAGCSGGGAGGGAIPDDNGGWLMPDDNGGLVPATGGSGGPDGVGGSGTSSGSAPSGTGATGPGPGTGGQGPVATCTPVIPATSRIPRITNSQYNRIVFDLLGVDVLTGANNVQPSTLLITDQAGSMNNQMWSAYRSVAGLVAKQVIQTPALKSKFMECTPAGDGTDCLKETIAKFGRKAFRRPISPDDQKRFDDLLAQRAEITENNTADEVAEVLLSAFLVSPAFLLRSELAETPGATPGVFALNSHEVASRLSFMLTGSVPDQTLRDEADKDALKTPEQILTQAKRLMDTDGARSVAAEFHRTYLAYAPNLSFWDSAALKGKDPVFAKFTKELVPDTIAETERLFDYVVFDLGGSFKDLVLTDVGFVTAGTAPLYGLEGGSYGANLTQVSLGPTRPGFLTRLAFLTGFADPGRTNPILRGAFITKHVLGVDPGDPDPNATMTALPTGANLDTNRKQVDAMTNSGPCAECHVPYVNPPGFVMEAFDTVGAPQTTERKTGASIDTMASISLMKDDPAPVPVKDPTELMQLISTALPANHLYAQTLVNVSYERTPIESDVCAVEALTTKLMGGAPIKELLPELTQTESFRNRTLEVTP